MLDEAEASVVRLIYDMASGRNGRPVGVKAIASHLNERGICRRGRKFSTGSIHQTLTNTVYHGNYIFNRRDTRNKVAHPPSQYT